MADDWRRQFDARRKALQRRRNRRRGVADGGATVANHGDRVLNGAAQTEEDFEQVRPTINQQIYITFYIDYLFAPKWFPNLT